MVIHIVEPGETVYSIAEMYGITPYSLIEDNGLTDPAAILPGQALAILFPAQMHTVQEGETLDSIAAQYNVSTFALMQNNPSLGGRTEVRPGQQLVISFEAETLRSILLAGSAHAYIDEDTLRSALPFLAMINILYSTFNEDGEVIAPPGEERILDMAEEYDVGLSMNLSALNDNGEFSLVLSGRAINNLRMQENLINNLISTMQEKGYDSVILDFMNVIPEDKENYLRFIETLASRLNAAGFPLVVRLYTYISGEEASLLLEGPDYVRIGNAVNAVILMVLATGYRLGAPRPGNPLDSVTEIVGRAVTEMPPEKIFICIPNYGFDWELPYRPGISAIRQIPNAEAIQLAQDKNVEILFDEEAYSPYFYYTDDRGAPHVVHFGDARSVDARARLVDEYGLTGICMWSITENYQPYWSVLNSLYDFEKME